MANKGLIGVQMSTIAPAKMPHFDAYESMASWLISAITALRSLRFP